MAPVKKERWSKERLERLLFWHYKGKAVPNRQKHGHNYEFFRASHSLFDSERANSQPFESYMKFKNMLKIFRSHFLFYRQRVNAKQTMR